MKTILFYGDSNTWGYDPNTALRYPYHLRWTTVCAKLLGEGYICIPAGMNGRTTAFDDPVSGVRNGIKGLDYELQTHKPLDLMVIMLGTNDLKFTDVEGSAAGMKRLIELVRNANERCKHCSPIFFGNDAPVLLISPILMKAHVGERDDDIAESARLSGLYKQIAESFRLPFLDAALHAAPSEIDGVHLDIDGHEKLGKAIAAKIKSLC